MNSIALSDKIFATVTSFGGTVCNIALDGVTSMGDIVRKVRDTIGDGELRAATLTVRNSSQGWATRSALKLTPRRVPEATQLSLF